MKYQFYDGSKRFGRIEPPRTDVKLPHYPCSLRDILVQYWFNDEKVCHYPCYLCDILVQLDGQQGKLTLGKITQARLHPLLHLGPVCGIPENSFINGTFSNLIYKKYKETFYSVVRSEKPLILDSIETDTAKIKGTVVVCTTMYGHPAKFNHWLTYQKTIGVDKVHLSVEHTS